MTRRLLLECRTKIHIEFVFLCVTVVIRVIVANCQPIFIRIYNILVCTTSILYAIVYF